MSKSEREYEVTGELQEDMTIKLTAGSGLYRVLYHLCEKKLLIKMSVFREKRSDKQNRYFHGVVVVCVRAWLAETQGVKWESDEVYYWINQEVMGNKPRITEIMGQQVITMTGKRFSQMTTKEFADAVDAILKHFAELGCNIPEPNQNNFIEDLITDN